MANELIKAYALEIDKPDKFYILTDTSEHLNMVANELKKGARRVISKYGGESQSKLEDEIYKMIVDVVTKSKGIIRVVDYMKILNGKYCFGANNYCSDKIKLVDLFENV